MTEELDRLQARIREAKQAAQPQKDPSKPDDADATRTGIRVVTDVIATPIVCGGIGIALDHWLQTGPIFFILLAFLGVITGFWNMARMMKGGDSSVGFKRLQNKEKEGNKAQLSGKDLDT